MSLSTQHIVQPFVRTKSGRIDGDRVRLCGTAEAARAMAQRLVADGIAVGALAISRSADVEMGEYETPEILVKIGRVPGDEDDLPF